MFDKANMDTPAKQAFQAMPGVKALHGLVLLCWWREEELHVTDGIRPFFPQLALEGTG